MKCPKCGSKKFKEIVYGLPDEELMKDTSVIIGGCIVDDESYDYECSKCGEGFNDPNKEIEEARDIIREFRKVVIDEFSLFEGYDYTEVREELEDKYAAYALKFDNIGGMVPVQADGKLGDENFYFRFRYDNATLMTGEMSDVSKLPNGEIYRMENVTGESLSGVLTPEEFRDLFIVLLEQHLVKINETR